MKFIIFIFDIFQIQKSIIKYLIILYVRVFIVVNTHLHLHVIQLYKNSLQKILTYIIFKRIK